MHPVRYSRGRRCRRCYRSPSDVRRWEPRYPRLAVHCSDISSGRQRNGLPCRLKAQTTTRRSLWQQGMAAEGCSCGQRFFFVSSVGGTLLRPYRCCRPWYSPPHTIPDSARDIKRSWYARSPNVQNVPHFSHQASPAEDIPASTVRGLAILLFRFVTTLSLYKNHWQI